MSAPAILARCFALAAFLATTACSTYVDARAEAALRDALLRVVGPAESYDVRVSGASLGGSRFERVRFVGHRIARADAPVLDRLELDLQGVVVDRAAKSLTAVAATRVIASPAFCEVTLPGAGAERLRPDRRQHHALCRHEPELRRGAKRRLGD